MPSVIVINAKIMLPVTSSCNRVADNITAITGTHNRKRDVLVLEMFFAIIDIAHQAKMVANKTEYVIVAKSLSFQIILG